MLDNPYTCVLSTWHSNHQSVSQYTVALYIHLMPMPQELQDLNKQQTANDKKCLHLQMGTKIRHGNK